MSKSTPSGGVFYLNTGFLFTSKGAPKASAFTGLNNGGPRNGLGLAVVYWP